MTLANKLEAALKDFFESHPPPYISSSNIEFCFGDDYVTAAREYPKYKHADPETELYIFYCSETIRSFIDEFRIYSIRDLESITQKQLLDLFTRGGSEIHVVELSGISFTLRFRKQTHHLIATDDEGDNHVVPLSLRNPADFNAYAKEYFKLLSLTLI